MITNKHKSWNRTELMIGCERKRVLAAKIREVNSCFSREIYFCILFKNLKQIFDRYQSILYRIALRFMERKLSNFLDYKLKN